MAGVALAARGEQHPRAAPLEPLGAGGAEREEMSPVGARAFLNSPGSVPIPAGQERPRGTAGLELLLLGLRGRGEGTAGGSLSLFPTAGTASPGSRVFWL